MLMWKRAHVVIAAILLCLFTDASAVGGTYSQPQVQIPSIIQRPGVRATSFGDSEDNFPGTNAIGNTGISGQFLQKSASGVLSTAEIFLGGRLNFDLSVGWPQVAYLGGISKVFVVSGGNYSVAPTGASIPSCPGTTLGTPVMSGSAVTTAPNTIGVPIIAQTAACPTGAAVTFTGGTGTPAVAYGLENQGGTFGASGGTTSQMVQYMRDACASPVDLIIMHGGTNNFGAGISVAQTEADLVTIWTGFMSPACGGKTVVYMSLLPRTLSVGSAQYLQLAAINRWAREWIAGEQALRPSGYGNIYFFNREHACTDRAAGAGGFLGSCSVDGLHEGNQGPWVLGYELAQFLSPLIGGQYDVLSPSLNNTYDATNNPTGALPFPQFSTFTGGQPNSPCDGAVPAGWSLNRYSGSATGTICHGVTENPRSDGLSGSRFEVTQSIGGTADSELFAVNLAANYTPASVGVTLGTDAVYATVQVEMSGIANVSTMIWELTCENSGGSPVQQTQRVIAPPNSGTLYGPAAGMIETLDMPPIVCPVGTAYIAPSLLWTMNPTASAASATATIKIANPVVQKYL